MAIKAARKAGLLARTPVHYVTKHLQQGIESDHFRVKRPMPRVGCFQGRVAKIFGVENYAPSMGALRSDQAISGPSNRFTDLVEVGEQASRRTVRRRFFRALNVCDTPPAPAASPLELLEPPLRTLSASPVALWSA